MVAAARVRPRKEVFGCGQMLSSQGEGDNGAGIAAIGGATARSGAMAEVIIGSSDAARTAPQGITPRANNNARNRNTKTPDGTPDALETSVPIPG